MLESLNVSVLTLIFSKAVFILFYFFFFNAVENFSNQYAYLHTDLIFSILVFWGSSLI